MDRGPAYAGRSGSNDEAAAERERLRQAADLVARILDSAIAIPGTRIRFGVDPMLGLIPGVGDAVANLIGSVLFLLATRLQIPRIVLVRMSVNMWLNGTLGAVPIAGDLFSVWFRSNARNAELLRRHSGKAGATTAGDWLFVGGLAVLTLATMVGAIVALLWVSTALWDLLSGWRPWSP